MKRKFIPTFENNIVTFKLCKDYMREQTKQRMAAKIILQDQHDYLRLKEMQKDTP